MLNAASGEAAELGEPSVWDVASGSVSAVVWVWD